MKDIFLNPCPFCNSIPILEKYYETCDWLGDRNTRIKCQCNAQLELTNSELEQVKKDFNYKCGYYSLNKEFWIGMHQRLVDKWNTRIKS